MPKIKQPTVSEIRRDMNTICHNYEKETKRLNEINLQLQNVSYMEVSFKDLYKFIDRCGPTKCLVRKKLYDKIFKKREVIVIPNDILCVLDEGIGMHDSGDYFDYKIETKDYNNILLHNLLEIKSRGLISRIRNK